jgi:undecaprenyl-diphosphatase
LRLVDAIVLGVIEGVTEYLPISSTGHLILASWMLGLNQRVDKDSLDAFNIVIQGGAILAVLGLYRERVRQIAAGLWGGDRVGVRLAVNIIAAFVPAAVLGFVLNDVIDRQLFFPIPVLSALAVGGVVMIWWGRSKELDASRVRLEGLTVRHALIIGFCQCLALWPGTSRSMVTILGGMLVGMRPREAAEFSFLLGVPTLGAACAYSLTKNLLGESATMFETLGVAPIVAGLLVATASAALAVRWLVAFLNRHGLSAFGWYRIALSLALGLLIWQGFISITPPG